MKTSHSPLQFPSEPIQARQISLPIGSAFKKIGQFFVQFFCSDRELKIWTTTDRYGNTNWHAYDPISGKSTSLTSEDDMRAWIERRYYN